MNEKTKNHTDIDLGLENANFVPEGEVNLVDVLEVVLSVAFGAVMGEKYLVCVHTPRST